MATGFLHGVEVVEVDDGTRSLRAVQSAVIGIVGTAPDADEQAFPLNTPVLVAGSLSQAAKLDKTGKRQGTLPNALDLIFKQVGAIVVVVRVKEGDDENATLTNILGGVNANGAYEGVHAFIGAQSIVGQTPRILIAPGFTHQRPSSVGIEGNETGATANPVAAELIGIAERLRAIVVLDAPNTTDEAALSTAKDFDSKRAILIDPFVKVNRAGKIIEQPASAAVAGVIAKNDFTHGFWHSPSNKVINGIVGTARPIDFSIGDRSSRANLFNEQNITTIIRENGYRLWGNRTLSSDTKFAFLSVVRTADMINDAILRGHLWAVDRNIKKTYMHDVSESVNAYLRDLKAQGAILGGRCTPDLELNTASAIESGKVYFNVEFTPTTPAEHITFRSQIINDYLEEIF
ncbi:phage tail sheath subtilisin-like domain-containing protein [Bartonella tribocorum]|uniref:Phage-related tail sheath protein n=1 Tax=Bartonella tribocorum (strain DSM 28219 / CCUG 45778 / CIP 105476 / IBS 506) TaxID=382640 RepID=A9INE8_BART1|nr:phage tail sheath subtilisin-like domain-containing protein [Bartonella tribocorum]CAK00787.1 phage-related tail sheath protein [Bartonella tribocorum CIP 105476]CAK00948.1 phage-related tail sheath protein [Bartonella tribocorum CIP 105476]CDO47983.1 phage tail sheath protein FI [Bartonella tribocorum]CDO48148.1 phage tail sheath protein FI [Bartonella tribocorum]